MSFQVMETENLMLFASDHETIRVYIAEDHDLVIRGYKSVFATADDFEVVGTSFNGNTLLHSVLVARPHILLLDVTMPGFDIFRFLEQFLFIESRPQVVLITSSLDLVLAQYSLNNGVSGYLLKEEALSDNLLDTLRHIARGHGLAFSEKVRAQLQQRQPGSKIDITAEERAILNYLKDDLDPKAISIRLGKSVKATYTKIERLRKAFGVETNAALVATALRLKLITLV